MNGNYIFKICNQNIKKELYILRIFLPILKWNIFIFYLEIRCNVSQLQGEAIVSPNRTTVRFNETVTYSCLFGYEMAGRPSNRLTATCTRSGRFSPNVLPKCQSKKVGSFIMLKKVIEILFYSLFAIE